MDRFTLLVFLCVFALSEVLLDAMKARIRGVAGMKTSSAMRFAHFASCVTDNQCEKACKQVGARGGSVNGNYDKDEKLCHCDGEVVITYPTCKQACKILGVAYNNDKDAGIKGCYCGSCH